MSTTILLMVLLAALLHASWNAIVKGNGDKFSAMMAVVMGSVPVAIAVLPFSTVPTAVALPYLLGSMALHVGYQLALLQAYRMGDLTQIYPIARGLAPLIVGAVSVMVLGETLTPFEMIGVAILAAGIISISFGVESAAAANWRAVSMALLTGVFISAYSLVDGWGARIGGDALGFYACVSIGNAVLFAILYAFARPGRFIADLRAQRKTALTGGTASFCAYALVVYCFTQAPITLVTAMRETSILFALFIGVVFLRERLDLRKVAAAFAILSGAVMTRVGKSL